MARKTHLRLDRLRAGEHQVAQICGQHGHECRPADKHRDCKCGNQQQCRWGDEYPSCWEKHQRNEHCHRAGDKPGRVQRARRQIDSGGRSESRTGRARAQDQAGTREFCRAAP